MNFTNHTPNKIFKKTNHTHTAPHIQQKKQKVYKIDLRKNYFSKRT